MYELDGERKHVTWQDVQTKYNEKYKTPLNSVVCLLFFIFICFDYLLQNKLKVYSYYTKRLKIG